MWEEHRLRVLENRVLRRIFGPRRRRGNRGVEKTTQMRSLMICTPHAKLVG